MAQRLIDKILRFPALLKESARTARRAFSEFLLLPTSVIGVFLLLTVASYFLDSVQLGWIAALRAFLKAHIFDDPQATSSLLSTIASSIITMTSITISLLLLAVQQSAGSMTSQVFDQFLRRWHNQFYFGYFIGLALYALITLATVNKPFNPVLGASIALLATVIALYLLLLLLYTTINQMRPAEIIAAIHGLILTARKKQWHEINRTRRTSLYEGTVKLPVKTETHGFVTKITFDLIEKAIGDKECEVEFSVSIGDFVAFGEILAVVKAETVENAETIVRAVKKAVPLERQRDIALDPAYGIEQISTIGWTSISTAKSSPAPGMLAILSLRDILARWATQGDEERNEKTLPIVYQDTVFEQLLQTFETLAVVPTESMQHQNYIEILRTFTKTFDALSETHQRRVEDIILRILSGLGDFVLTTELEASLSALEYTLKSAQRFETARAIHQAKEKLALSVGKLNSRSTRVEN